VTGAQEAFRAQLQNLVVQVLNRYWDLVAETQTLKSTQRSLEVSQKFLEDTRNQIEVGVLARVALPRAQAEVASRQQDLVLAQMDVRQRENSLKELLSRTEDPMLEAAQIVPLDQIQIPETDNLPSVRELVARARAQRPDVAIAKINDDAAEISLLGTQNSLLPTALAFGSAWDAGVAGTPQLSGGKANNFFVGGFGTALGQVFRRNFPNERGGAYISIPLYNRQAQGDYGIDQLQFRKSQLSGQKDSKQIEVDISNQVIGLRQARARYTAAVNTRTLQEQLLKAEQDKFNFGISSVNNIIQAQRALVSTQSAEVTALASYSQARVAMDQLLGETLEVNHVSLAEGLSGRK